MPRKKIELGHDVEHLSILDEKGRLDRKLEPETATAAALTGKITDPRELGINYPRFREPQVPKINREMFVAPADGAGDIELAKGPNIKTLPDLEPIPRDFRAPVLIKLGDGLEWRAQRVNRGMGQVMHSSFRAIDDTLARR